MKKILISGGCGFIGSHLVDRLVREGHEVVVLDDFSSGTMDNLRFSSEKVELINGSILDKEAVKKAINGVNMVYHLAAVVGVRHYVEDPMKVMMVNVKGTENLLEASAKGTVTKFVMASTSEVYGKNMDIPLSENSERILGSTSIDRWCYSTAKALDEHMCFAYNRKYDLPFSIVRYFNVYGPRQQSSIYSGVIPIFINRILDGKPPQVHGDGQQTRCFTHIKDIIDGTILVGKKGKNEIYNLGSTNEITILDLANKIIKLMDTDVEPEFVPYGEFYGKHYEDLRRRVPDCTKVKEAFGWEPTTDFNAGLCDTINDCKRRYKNDR